MTKLIPNKKWILEVGIRKNRSTLTGVSAFQSPFVIWRVYEMYQGYIKLWRKIQDSKQWTLEKFTRGQAWIDLLLLANHKEQTIMIRGIEITVKRGQLAYSELSLAKRWKWSRNKVRSYLADLASNPVQQIEQQKSNVTSLITILNYDQYQGNDTPKKTPERHQKDTKRYTNNNDKNVKNDKKSKYGEFKNVLLTENELKKLREKFNSDYLQRIESLSQYIESKGKKYKSHYATILMWSKKDKKPREDIDPQKEWQTPDYLQGITASIGKKIE